METLEDLKKDISEVVDHNKILKNENKRLLIIIEQKEKKISNLFNRIHFLELELEKEDDAFYKFT